MAVIDFGLLRDIKMSDEQIQSIFARMTLQELKDYRYDDGKGN